MPDISLLLVDDERPLLGLLKKYLEREGFSVETAENGAEAFTAAEARRFDLIVLDLNLPGMGGEDVMNHLLGRYPDCRVLISSGTPFSNEGVSAEHRARVGFLMKPYMPRQLRDAIHSTLGGPP